MPRGGSTQLWSVVVGLIAGVLLVTVGKAVVPQDAPRTLRPLYHRLALVAGSGDEGTTDGPFAEARFREPAGLAADPSGKLLVIADREGHRLRGVKLDDANRVVTLAGTGRPGSADGALSSASFDRPSHVQFIGSYRLVVWDAGTGLLRVVDLESGTVRTLRAAGTAPFEEVWALAASEKEIFLSQPGRGRLVRVDVASGLARVLIEGDSRVPHPGALAFHDTSLYLADRDGTEVFRLAAPEKGPSDLTVAGTPGLLVAMASAGGVLYGLRAAAGPPLIRALTGEPVPLISAWGQDLPGGGPVRPYLEVPVSPPVGFAADPRAERTLFVTSPALRRVLSIRDLDQGARRDALTEWPGEPDDDSYPKRKSAGVFRLLVVGDSHIFYGTDKEIEERLGNYPRALTFPKRLELALNTRAALEGRPVTYEVLTKVHGSSTPLGVWPVYEVPTVAKTWDVDTVLLMMPPASSTLDAWMNHPPGTDGGIPTADVDPEYLLLPPEAKLQKSPAAALFRACQKRGLATASPEGRLEIGASLGKLASEPELRREALELYGRPLELLKKRLAPRRLVFCFYPLGSREGLGEERGFYRELCEKRGIELLDLVPAFDIVREAFYPLGELSGNDHFHAAGHGVFGYLVAHELVFRQIVPF
jgi:hypothetical protein